MLPDPPQFVYVGTATDTTKLKTIFSERRETTYEVKYEGKSCTVELTKIPSFGYAKRIENASRKPAARFVGCDTGISDRSRDTMQLCGNNGTHKITEKEARAGEFVLLYSRLMKIRIT